MLFSKHGLFKSTVPQRKHFNALAKRPVSQFIGHGRLLSRVNYSVRLSKGAVLSQIYCTYRQTFCRRIGPSLQFSQRSYSYKILTARGPLTQVDFEKFRNFYLKKLINNGNAPE